MRASALLLLCSGCLISEPDGASQAWPPSLGGKVEAVVSGDLDANGSLDVVVMMSGVESQAGLYLLKSNVDLVWDTGNPFRSFSTFIPVPLVHPTAAFIDASVAPRLFVVTGEDTLGITSYANNLNELATGETNVAGGTNAWTKRLVFPGGQVHYAVSNGSTIEHVDGNLADRHPLPAPMSPTWTQAQTVTSYTDGSDQWAVVATATTIQRCVIPLTMGAQFAWEPVRDEAAMWSGQTTYDFNNDGREEIVGFDVGAHQLCIVDPGVAGSKACLTLASTWLGTDVTILAGHNISMSPGNDILVVQASGMETRYSLAEDVTYTPGTPGTLTATAQPMIMAKGPAGGRTVVTNPGGGLPVSVLTFGVDGDGLCALGPC